MANSDEITIPELDSIEIKRREAEGDIAGFKEERLRDSLFKEQAKFREMTNASYAYDPWGRPGAGAPLSRQEHKKRKFTEYDGFQNDVGVTGLFDDMRLNRNFSTGNTSEKSLEETQAKINSYRQELRMVRADRAKNQTFEFFDPWGKGQGNPRRGNDGYVERKIAAIKECGIVPQLDSEADRISAESLRNHELGVGLDTKSPYGGGGEPFKTRSGNVKTRFPTTMKRDIYGNVNLEEASYDPFKSMSTDSSTTYFPFGKPGGGAPLKSDEGKVIPNRRGVDFNRELDTSDDISKRKEAADQYLVEIKKEMFQQRRTRELEREDQLAPFGELASVVRQGKVGFPQRDPNTGHVISTHKATSDITKHKDLEIYDAFLGNSIRWHGENNSSSKNPKEYYDQLTQLADQRHKQRQSDRELELQQESQHSAMWSDLWGRPGGGAPVSKDAGYKKTKLDKALHHPDIAPPQPPPKVPKNLSSHENNFQLGEDRRLFKPQNGYGVLAPYATN